MRPILFLLVAWVVLGCASPAEAPPAAGRPCELDRDCNAGTCGMLALCLSNRCEATPSLVIPCLDGAVDATNDAGVLDGSSESAVDSSGDVSTEALSDALLDAPADQ